MIKLRRTHRIIGFAASVAALVATVGIAPPVKGQIRSEKVQFAAGASSATRTGSVRGNAIRDYELDASAGQTMTVKLTSKSTALYFNVVHKDTMLALETDPQPIEITEWSGTLPKSGTYVIRVYLVRAAARRNASASYSVNFSITGGATSVLRHSTFAGGEPAGVVMAAR